LRPPTRRLLAWLLAWLLLGVAPAGAAESGRLEDPRRYERLGSEALAGGDLDAARGHFAAMLEQQEIIRYLPYRGYLGEALVLERLGREEEAAAKYRFGIEDDALRAVQVLRILSRHPEREALVAEAYAHVRALAEAAAAGEQVVIYTTSKGAPRHLTPITQDEVLATARAGGRSRYCYLPALDLSHVPDPLPEKIHLSRCVVGRVLIPDRDVPKLVITGFVLGDVDVGKTWEGAANKSRTVPASRFGELFLRDVVFLGRANFSDVLVGPGKTYFPMAVFEGPVSFRGGELSGEVDFRFASFGADADFRGLRMSNQVYFGGTRFREDTTFSRVFSERTVLFNSATFERSANFDDCEWRHAATFEDARFMGRVSLSATHLRERLNLSRAVFHEELLIDGVDMGELDMLGADLRSELFFTDSTVRGHARFAPDALMNSRGLRDLAALLPAYRDYQGDEDAEAPLATTTSYGVESISDLVTRFRADASFANTLFEGYTVFQGVHFGGGGRRGLVSFMNAQFRGETHFESSIWDAAADFTSIFGSEMAFNRATFRDSLIMDDAYVQGRVTLSDATFEGDADWSWYASEIRTFQLGREHVDADDVGHRLFYEKCALGTIDRGDPRIRRMTHAGLVGDDALQAECYDRLVDEFIELKDAFAEQAMFQAEDDAWWWERHHENMAKLRFGDTGDYFNGLLRLFLFELCFGWGVRLSNLGICTLVVTAIFAWLYRWLCPDTMLAYDGENIAVRDVSYVGLFFVSLQSLLAINTGWDFGDDDHRFRYLNTIETLIGVIILTFFVGAYTRMILA